MVIKKEPTPEDINRIDSFNAFMLDKKIFLMKDGNIYQNHEKVIVGGYEYTLAMAMAEFKRLH